MISLLAQPRNAGEKLLSLRESGRLPAVVYGAKMPSAPISISHKDFVKTYKTAGESSIVSLVLGTTETTEETPVLIQDVARDPVTGAPIHVDFYAIEKDKALKIKVPIEFTGEAPAVRDGGGILVKVLRELEIESLPKDLPHSISVDISVLTDLQSQILAVNIVLPKGVTLVTHANEVVAAMTEAKEEVEETPAPVDLSTIEVEKKGKEAKEGEEEETPAPPEGKDTKKDSKPAS